ncbi:MAG: hypothetical protein EP330_29970 [Deltaproteobacteria bacterium]|nr:MAG: hypothetical protein EP330_29970 [Deltaproteobacteria bacterium]
MEEERVRISPGSTNTLLVAAFILALLGLLLGFHNVRQRSAAMTRLDGMARTHTKANADARITALEAERDTLNEKVDALSRRLDALEAASVDAAAP